MYQYTLILTFESGNTTTSRTFDTCKDLLQYVQFTLDMFDTIQVTIKKEIKL